MFGQGAQRLLAALPQMGRLDPTEVRRLLSGAWLDAIRLRDLDRTPNRHAAIDLRRFATALEVRLFVGAALDAEPRRATAFVAAECLGVARELTAALRADPTDETEHDDSAPVAPDFVLVEEALLYVIAGFDANAALTAAEISDGLLVGLEGPAAAWAATSIRTLLDHTRPVPDGPAPAYEDDWPLRDRVRHELWCRIGGAVRAHVRWLRLMDGASAESAADLQNLAADLHNPTRRAAVAHTDIHHLCLLLAGACEDTANRALRRVPPPDGDDAELFARYQRGRAGRMPLLWPAAARYADSALPGPSQHAVVTVPTGAGKSAVAELAAAQALSAGWVLYLAPTNALVGQIRRDLERSLSPLGVGVRGLTGGAEFSVSADDTLDLTVGDRTIAVMTPEKCSLALRQTPEMFSSLALCVLDEAHLIREGESRGVVAELVLSEVMHRAQEVRLLLMSALVENPETLSRWLHAATGVDAVDIVEPWRPTRTLRALAGVDAEATALAEADAAARLAALPPRRKTEGANIPIRLLGALHGTWSGEEPGDYEIVDTSITITARIPRSGRLPKTDHTAAATKALTQALADAGHRVLTFLPGSRHYPFAHAKDLNGAAVDGMPPEVETLLTLADAEIAGPNAGEVSALRAALNKGIAVHTSVMTREEQRASELAFETGAVLIMLATGTLAQGLNLPATAVVVGGTRVGRHEAPDTPEARARTKAQLLNAIGRAGRAQIAARSLAIVVPARPVRIAQNPEIQTARAAAPFLGEEDGSTRVTSRLDNLIAGALGNSLQLATMGVAEQAAFAFLSFTAESGDATSVLARTLATHAVGAADQAERITGALRALGRHFLDDQQTGAWIAMAAHRAGVSLPTVAALQHPLRSFLASEAEPPRDVAGWARLMVDVLVSVDRDVLLTLLDGDHINSTSLTAIRSDSPPARDQAAATLLAVLTAWLQGKSLTVVGARLHQADAPIGVNRASGAELPRTIRFVRDGIEHRLTSVAGAMVAIVLTGAEADAQGPWQLPQDSVSALGRLPVAIRVGAADPAVLALAQAGVRPRVVAHLLARLVPPPEEIDYGLLDVWAGRTASQLADVDFADGVTSDPGERGTLRAAAHLRTFA